MTLVLLNENLCFQSTIMLPLSAACGISRRPIGKSFGLWSSCAHPLCLHSDIRFSLKRQLRSLTFLTRYLGIVSYLENTANNVSWGALEVLPTVLIHALPTSDLLEALKQPFHPDVMSRTPSSSAMARKIINDYLMVSYTCWKVDAYLVYLLSNMMLEPALKYMDLEKMNPNPSFVFSCIRLGVVGYVDSIFKTILCVQIPE